MNETEILVLEDTSVSSDFDELCAIIQGLRTCIPYGIVSMTWTRRTFSVKIVRSKHSGDLLNALSDENFVAQATRELRCAALAAKSAYRRRL